MCHTPVLQTVNRAVEISSQSERLTKNSDAWAVLSRRLFRSFPGLGGLCGPHSSKLPVETGWQGGLKPGVATGNADLGRG